MSNKEPRRGINEMLTLYEAETILAESAIAARSMDGTLGNSVYARVVKGITWLYHAAQHYDKYGSWFQGR
jgi:hypothetical protein